MGFFRPKQSQHSRAILYKKMDSVDFGEVYGLEVGEGRAVRVNKVYLFQYLHKVDLDFLGLFWTRKNTVLYQNKYIMPFLM